MAEFRKYVIEWPSGTKSDHEVDTVEEARKQAARESRGEQVAIVAHVYEFSDSELVEVWENGAEIANADCFPYTEETP